MAKYLFQGTYTSEAWAAQVCNPAGTQHRLEAVRQVVERLGGRIECDYYAFGEYDVVTILEMPDHVSMAAFASAVSARGAAKAIKTTPLMTIEEGIEAMRKASGTGYRPPGSSPLALAYSAVTQPPYTGRRSSTPTPQEIIASLYSAINARNFDAYTRFLTPDCQLRAKGGVSVRGVEAHKAFDMGWVSGFLDCHIPIEKQVADASSVIVENRFIGTHTGTLRGAAGEVPATGKQVDVTYVAAFEFQGDKVKSTHIYYDQLELFQQLGLMPVPGNV